MQKKIEKIAKRNSADFKAPIMTRKEALKKSGYLALSAATMMILLSSPDKAQAQTSPSPPPPF